MTMAQSRQQADPVAIRLAELQEALLTRTAVEIMLERSVSEEDAVRIVMSVMDKIVQEKRVSRTY